MRRLRRRRTPRSLGQDICVTDGGLREVTRIAHERGTGARGLRAVIESVLEPVLFDPQPWETYRVTEATVLGGPIETLDCFGLPAALVEPASPAAPLRHRMGRKSAGRS